MGFYFTPFYPNVRVVYEMVINFELQFDTIVSVSLRTTITNEICFMIKSLWIEYVWVVLESLTLHNVRDGEKVGD